MRKSVRYVLGLIIILSLLRVAPSHAQSMDSQFFDQTKHNVQRKFWIYYQSVPDAETLLGYPITEEFINSDGILVQYFQRGRLEIQNGKVYLTPLGILTYREGVQLSIDNPLACRGYKSGFLVCFAFLEFFDAHGGLAFFGEPISPFEYQDNMIVQYFQNGRLEWNPSNPEGQRVVMGNLGLVYFNMAGEDPARLDPVQPLNAGTIPQVMSLNVRAFPWKAVTYSTDEQVIFVVVQDQTLQPVAGAAGQAKVIWTSGAVDTFPIISDKKGIATLSLPVTEQDYGGLVTVEVQVMHGDFSVESSTSFRIWY